LSYQLQSRGGDVILERAAQEIIASRFLIVQAKRLLLSSAYRRHLHVENRSTPRDVIARLEGELERADRRYRTAVLEHASPASADYWIIVYARLLEVGEDLTEKMRTAAVELPPGARFEVSTDIEALQLILERWNASMKRSMVDAVA